MQEMGTVRLLASRYEAAEALAVSVRTIDALEERGELQAVRIGARKLFPWSELRRFADVKRPITTDESGESKPQVAVRA